MHTKHTDIHTYQWISMVQKVGRVQQVGHYVHFPLQYVAKINSP
jgi:hypothetical protein